jgi:hypothetical protein
MGMSPNLLTRAGYRCEVVDMHAELKYWRQSVADHAFYESGTPFSRYEPLLRFSYDAYLRYYAQPLEDVIDSIRQKYGDQFDEWHNPPWSKVEPVLQEVWMRMGAPTGAMHSSWRNARREACIA